MTKTEEMLKTLPEERKRYAILSVWVLGTLSKFVEMGILISDNEDNGRLLSDMGMEVYEELENDPEFNPTPMEILVTLRALERLNIISFKMDFLTFFTTALESQKGVLN